MMGFDPAMGSPGGNRVIARRAIAIAANFTAEPIRETVAFWMEVLALPLDVSFAPFDRIFRQVLDPSSLLSNVVLLELDEWLGAPRQRPRAPFPPSI